MFLFRRNKQNEDTTRDGIFVGQAEMQTTVRHPLPTDSNTAAVSAAIKGRLQKLQALHDKGLVNDYEYAVRKDKILGDL